MKLFSSIFRIRAVCFRVLHQMIKDYYMMMMLFLGPVMTFWLLFVVFQDSHQMVKLGVVLADSKKSTFSVDFLKKDFILTIFSSKEEGIQALERGEYPALLILKKQQKYPFAQILLEGTEPLKSQKVMLLLFRGFIQESKKSFEVEFQKYERNLRLREFKKALEEKDQKTLQALGESFKNFNINRGKGVSDRFVELPNTPEEFFEVSYLYGKKLDYFHSIAPTLISFLVFFIVFLIGGISFLRERSSKTLSRTFATPIQDWQFILGYFSAFSVIIFLLVIGLQLFAIFGLHIEHNGSFYLLLFVNLLVSFVGLIMGFIFSTLAKTEFQLVQWIPIVIIPQFIFSGIFDTSFLPPFVNYLGRLFPIHYASSALVDISIRGRGIAYIWPAILKLCLFMLILLIFNSFLLKKIRQHEG